LKLKLSHQLEKSEEEHIPSPNVLFFDIPAHSYQMPIWISFLYEIAIKQ